MTAAGRSYAGAIPGVSYNTCSEPGSTWRIVPVSSSFIQFQASKKHLPPRCALWPLWPVSTTYGLGKYVFIRGTCKAHIVSCHLSNTDEGAPCRVSNTTKKTFAKCQIKSPCSTFRVIYHTISRQTKSHNERKARRQANPDVTLGMRLRFLPIPNAASC